MKSYSTCEVYLFAVTMWLAGVFFGAIVVMP